jgi:hypothetical protein
MKINRFRCRAATWKLTTHGARILASDPGKLKRNIGLAA